MKKKLRHIIVRSRNVSCRPLRDIVTDKRIIFRMGSTTPTSRITKRTDYIEINSTEACRISGDKILMKKAFEDNNIPTAEYVAFEPDCSTEIIKNTVKMCLEEWKRIIIKHRHSSKGNGIFFIDSQDALDEWLQDHHLTNYVYERYYTYSREYRIHVTDDGCFYACRKMLKNDATDRWHRHDSNSVWILEDNEMFNKPSNWDAIVQSCIDAKNAVGLDVCAIDVKVQTKEENPQYIILETNSAPSLGSVGIERYKKLFIDSFNNQ